MNPERAPDSQAVYDRIRVLGFSLGSCHSTFRSASNKAVTMTAGADVAPHDDRGIDQTSWKLVMRRVNKTDAMLFVDQRRHLFDDAARANPFTCSEWVLNFIEHVADDSWTFIIPECHVHGESAMLLQAGNEAPYRWAAVANYYTSLYSPLIASAASTAERGAALATLVRQMATSRPRCAVMEFGPLDKDAPDTAALRECLSGLGWYAREYFRFGNWYLPCAGLSFADYMAGRDSQLRNTWTRKSKKFGDSSPGGGRLEIITKPDEVASGMAAYQTIYAKSWKDSEPYPALILDWAAICARNGWLRLGVAWAGDVPIAAQFWFTMNRRAYIFKLAYDEDYAAWSAGTVLSAHMFKHALENDQVVEIDYLTGDDPYKKNWVSNRRERVGLIACNPFTSHGFRIACREYAGHVRRNLPFRRFRQSAVRSAS